MPDYRTGVTAYGKIRVEIDIDGVTDLFEQISNKALDVLEAFVIMSENLPTRGELLYHAFNKPWETDNWIALAAGWRVTKRKIRQQRAELENMKHIAWAQKLNTRKEFRAQ